MTTKDTLALALDALKLAEESLGSFVSDHGCSQSDMDNLDTVTAAITAIKQAQDVALINEGDMPKVQSKSSDPNSIVVENITVVETVGPTGVWVGEQQAITQETGNAANPEASAITAGNGQAQEPDHPGACKTCGNTYLASRTDVHKDKRPFIYCDCCGAMADSKTWYLTHGPAPKQAEPESCHQTGVCVRSGLAAENHARVIECAMRLVEHADFALGGILSADSKAKDIPSKAVSQVKSRHLAALRDALPTPPEAA
jgi:hypothetical protein